ncbi:ABC transporter ATP-binding protein/permease [Lapidilactobacillus wuchangensis]|uniref:ABC transporter ATP-binding protein/permease n=1 Tax=Lapidilactobacillus wuchangensis TaxID=2486001 RepID=UPI000F7A805F|nr:ABC transporter ATP-binding protein/permease [Lapidilactobacillus wuchangensis]
MLELKNIKKYYQVGDTTTKALDGVSVAFREKEFVAILGASGSGKTTLLNVIGGLDEYDSGDLVINGKSTKKFKATDWDAYRNNSVGFIFQSYNLIGHLGIIDNVELGMTLSGVSNAEKRQRAEDALTRVGLREHMHKKPNQLSGGQMQRVAIARALANDPDILLCDEPTGALDTETSVQIMELIQELSKEKLVIMVTHNPELAHQYANRIIEFSDGQIRDDSRPYNESAQSDTFKLKRTKMSFWTALKLSFTNIRTKKGRTFLTAFASSIGIISIGVVLALSGGFQKQIDETQSKTLAQYPITISQQATDMQAASAENPNKTKKLAKAGTQITAKVSAQEKATHINKIDQKYLNYVNDINPDLSNNIGYTRLVGMNLIRKVDGKVQPVTFSSAKSNSGSQSSAAAMAATTGVGTSSFPKQLDNSKENFLKKNYRLLSGAYPKAATDVVLVVKSDNTININALNNLGFDVKDGTKLDFSKIVGTKIQMVMNNDYYQQLPTGNFIPSTDVSSLYDKPNNLTLTVSGIIRARGTSNMDLLASGIAYSDDLAKEVIQKNQDSEIVKAQKASAVNVMTNQKMDSTTKQTFLSTLGGSSLPYSIMIYPNNFKDKDKVLTYLDKWNKGKSRADKITYLDLAGTVTNLTGGLMDAITYVLIAFAAISLITSMIMIGILTYTSVLERTKEIGVLRALGARSKDVTRVFDAETFILGISSGLLGIIIAELLTFPINSLLYNLTELKNVAILDPMQALILVLVSTVLTMIGGHIPARMAAKKDAAIALRAE